MDGLVFELQGRICKAGITRLEYQGCSYKGGIKAGLANWVAKSISGKA
jgi:hypothetical protein